MIYPANLSFLNSVIESNRDMSKAPLIGISANIGNGNSMICNTYVQSILMSGATPILIPVHTEIDSLKSILNLLDGVVLSGGGDINPLYGGEEPLPSLKEIDIERDQYDFTLVKLASERQIPLFGICRGMQVINMAFGGSNYQDIYTQHPEKTLKHSQSIEQQYGSHTVNIEKGSILAAAMGCDSVVVNSFHHQAVSKVAPGFRVSARSSDNIIEAIEAIAGQFILGVQWHPEKMTIRPDKEMLSLFQYFINEADLYKRAKEIHNEGVIIDSHCDTPMKFTPDFDIGKRNAFSKVDLPKMRDGMVDAVIMVAYLPQGARDQQSSENATKEAINILYRISEQVNNNSDKTALAYTQDDLWAVKQSGKKAIMPAIENGYAIGKDLKNLKRFKDAGIVYITLCHNGSNDICDSSVGTPEHNGLSKFGKEVVMEMNRLGIAIDLSHAGEKSFYDVLAISTDPVMVSHSSARALCDHPRNLTDKQIKALAERGGVIQICLYPHFLRKGGDANIYDAIAHINHIVKVAGIDHVGIGSDFDGDGEEMLVGCRTSNELINLTIELLRDGYSKQDIIKIWGGNLLRVIDEVQLGTTTKNS